MKKEVAEIAYGKHITYEVLSVNELSGKTYMVQMSSGNRRSPFNCLGEAVART